MTIDSNSFHLSKSLFAAGWQCHKQLWWRVRERDAPELQPDDALSALFEMGKRVGERARREFPGALLIDSDRTRPADAVARTRQALEGGKTVILEASFFEDDVFVAIDALSKEGEEWVVTEVKATTRVKAEHLPDAAVQAHVVERAGLRVGRVELMHLNPRHRHSDDGPLFTRADVSEIVADMRREISAEVRAQLRTLEGPLPAIAPGKHCTTPRACPFLDRCRAPLPDHAVEELNGIGKKKLASLRASGVETIDRIPSDFVLSPIQARQREAVRGNRTIVMPGLRAALSRYAFPIAMLDFESIAPALPVWEGCGPFGKVPVQFSVHTLEQGGQVTKRGYLSEGGSDPRPVVAAALAGALRGAQTVLAWGAPFEKSCLKILAASSPAHESALLAAREKTWDLHLVVREFIYHPGFRGSFTIKSVVRALLPHMAYDELDVKDGRSASSFLEALILRPHDFSEEERLALRERLATYCERDTLVLVSLFRLLGDVAP